MSKKTDIASLMRQNTEITLKQKLEFVIFLSLPSILMQIAEIAMQYIDSAMVGQLGANASASIGLVSSSTWLIGGLMSAGVYGFSVQVAHAIGAGEHQNAGNIVRQALITCIIYALILTTIALVISPYLPIWLGADVSIQTTATAYFRIYAMFIMARMLYFLTASLLQCSGDMKTPSILGSLMCLFDVVLNAILIFPSGTFSLLGISIPGFGLNVTGAALGTALSYVICLIPSFYFVYRKFNLNEKGSWKLKKHTLKSALKIGVPLGLEQSSLTIAQILTTRIIAPLGTIAIAANSFAVTAEAFCYMPGYGISSAATTLVGQALGAKRKDLAKSFAWLTTATAVFLMTIGGIIMYFGAPYVFAFLTPVTEVQQLGVSVLRIELFAEPLFAASIVATGALRGAGDTMVPFLMNLFSMWAIRLTLAAFLTPQIGLAGAWIAMAVELCFRGIIFIIRIANGNWLKTIEE